MELWPGNGYSRYNIFWNYLLLEDLYRDMPVSRIVSSLQLSSSHHSR
jgi:hypothetical protein